MRWGWGWGRGGGFGEGGVEFWGERIGRMILRPSFSLVRKIGVSMGWLVTSSFDIDGILLERCGFSSADSTPGKL